MLSVGAAPSSAGVPGTKFGTITIGGAVRAKYALTGQCVTFTLPALAASPGAKTLGMTVLAERNGAHQYRLFTVIDEDLGKAPVKDVNLASTRETNVQFSLLNTVNQNASELWEAGWWRVQAPGEPFAHYGAGTLTMAANAQSGSITASLQPVGGAGRSRVTVQGSWNCSTVSHAPS